MCCGPDESVHWDLLGAEPGLAMSSWSEYIANPRSRVPAGEFLVFNYLGSSELQSPCAR